MFKVKKFANDLIWSIAALAVMNIMSQFVLYPILRNALGPETYGNVLYLIGTTNIMATSIGIAANLARLKMSVTRETNNVDSTVWLATAMLVCFPICWLLQKSSGMTVSFGQVLLFWILTCATILRFYADVEYRLHVNYKGYFLYYLFVTAGYGLGIVLFRVTGLWQLILLPGELAGLILVWFKGSILKYDGPINKSSFHFFMKIVLNLMASQLMINIVLNADRLILQSFYGGEAVTQYYIASLLGKTMALVTTPLNSVIIGHLARQKDQMQSSRFLKFSLIGVVGILVIFAVCFAGSHIFVRLFYPNDYHSVTWLFLPANLAQIFYFAVGILTTVLLRYISERFQTAINVFYVIVFVAFTIPATKIWGLAGFAWALLLTNALRYAFATAIGYAEMRKLDPKAG